MSAWYKTGRRFIVNTAVFGTFLILSGYATAADKPGPFTVNMFTAPFGVGSFIIGTAVEKLSQKYGGDQFRVVSTESTGFVTNLREMGRRPELNKNTLFGVTKPLLYLGDTGKLAFKGKPVPSKDFRFVFGMPALTLIFVTADPKVKNIKDLNGKSVGLGRKAQIFWSVGAEEVFKANNVNVKTEALGPIKATSAFLDGRFDAVITAVYHSVDYSVIENAPNLTKLEASGRDLYYIPITREQVDTTRKTGWPDSFAEIPAGSFRTQKGKLSGMVSALVTFAHKDFPEEIAYGITNMLVKNYKKISKFHALGKTMIPSTLCSPLFTRAEYHPGALRACEEAGLAPK